MTGHMTFLQASKALSSITVSLSATSAIGTGFGPGVAQTNPVTATASGGTGGPYTYLWAWVSGDVEVTVVSSTSASTRFAATLGLGDIFFGDFTCTVSDGVSSTTSAIVTATLLEVS